MKNKKAKIIVTLVLVGVILFSIIAYAIVTEKFTFNQKTTTATVKVQNQFTIEDKLKGTMGESVSAWQPGDANLIKWETTNIGTSAIYTRQTIQVYWNEAIEDTTNKYLYLYPANMTNQQILEDISQANPQYAIETAEGQTINTDNGERIGFQYTFLGDELDGTSTNGFSKEKNYNNSNFTTTTDDSNANKDTVAFRIVLDKNTPYLYQNKNLTIKIITEAMQHTTDGAEAWQIVDTHVIE